jgi:hypothetical protein
MEERLDDAINVLRNHAESQALGLHAIAASSAAVAAAAAAANLQTHSNGLLGSYHHTTQPTLDSHLVQELCNEYRVDRCSIYTCCFEEVKCF